MRVIPAKTPEIVKSLFPNFVWTIPTDSKDLFLTFDDGPTPEISEWVLDLLNTYKAKATFFCIGNNIKAYPHIFQSILQNGHSIGNHTFSHLKGWKIRTKDYVVDTTRTDELIIKELEAFQLQNGEDTYAASSQINQGHKLFRPPYGKFKTKQSKTLQNLGYKIVLWDVLSFDWDKTITKEQCLDNVISKAKPGSIVVFHDSIKAQRNLKYALPKVLEYFSNKGYNFKAIA